MKSHESPLVSCEWLAEHLTDQEVVILDATFFLPNQGRDAGAEYAAEHLPGARFFDVDAVADHSSALPHMLPTAGGFEEAAGKLGIAGDSLVVTYDSNEYLASARAWWMFRIFGHERVCVLDGGLSRWKALGLPLSAEPAPPKRSEFTAEFHPELVRGLEQIHANLQNSTFQLVDARSPGRFTGQEPEPRPGLRSGHIPGSRNLFFERLIDPETHQLKDFPELSREFQAAGIDADGPIVATCGTGVSAAVLALALYRLGYKSAAIYDGSWTEWGSLAHTPVETAR